MRIQIVVKYQDVLIVNLHGVVNVAFDSAPMIGSVFFSSLPTKRFWELSRAIDKAPISPIPIVPSGQGVT